MLMALKQVCDKSTSTASKLHQLKEDLPKIVNVSPPPIVNIQDIDDIDDGDIDLDDED